MLGHHKDDHGENILRSIFHGVDFDQITGIQSETSIKGMRILRPLLFMNKKTIGKELSIQSLQPLVDDETNNDTKYWRSAVRNVILPTIESNLGKSVASSLSRFATQSNDLVNLLESVCSLIEVCQVKSITLICVGRDSNPICIRYIIRKYLPDGVFLSTHLMQEVVSLVLSGASNKYKLLGNHVLYIDRSWIYIWEKDFEDIKNHGLQCSHESVSLVTDDEIQKPTVKEYIKKGYFSIYLNDSERYLTINDMNKQQVNKYKKWIANNKLPIRLMKMLPYVVHSNVLDVAKMNNEMTSTELMRKIKLGFCINSSIALIIFFELGFVNEPKRLTMFPLPSRRNLLKFHVILPENFFIGCGQVFKNRMNIGF